MPQLELIDICWLSSIWIVIVAPIFILYSARSVLQLIKPNHRLCSPNIVWWCLIPVIGHYLIFSTAAKIATSVHRQFHEIGHHISIDQYGANSGKYWALSGVLFNSYVLIYMVFYIKYSFVDLLKFDNSAVLIPVVAVRGTNAFLYWMVMIRNHRRLMNYLKPEMSDDEMNYHDEGKGDS